MQTGQCSRRPVHERRSGGHHHGVHLQAVVLGELGKRSQSPVCEPPTIRLRDQPRGSAPRSRNRARSASLCAMPSRELVAFGPTVVTATTISRGQSAGAAICSQTVVAPRFVSSTTPPSRDRGADPEPDRAISARRWGSSCRPSAPAPAVTSAAKPDADEARPAPVGKSLRELDLRATRHASLPAQQIEAGGDAPR